MEAFQMAEPLWNCSKRSQQVGVVNINQLLCGESGGGLFKDASESSSIIFLFIF